MATEKQQIEALGWAFLGLSARAPKGSRTKSFTGAVQSFTASNGESVAVCFNMHDAFIVEDDQGLFFEQDLIDGIIKDSAINIEELGNLDGVKILAWEKDGVVSYDEEHLAELGLQDFGVQEELRTRLSALSKLDREVTDVF